MPEDKLMRIELERILNLVVGFGWTKTEEKTSAGEVLLTLRKAVPVKNEEMTKIDIERIVNLVAGFGWAKVKEEIGDGEVLLTLRKAVPVTEEP